MAEYKNIEAINEILDELIARETKAIANTKSDLGYERHWGKFDTIEEIKYRIEKLPAADVVPVVHGVWIEEEKKIEFYGCIDKQTFYKCSLCGRYEEKQEPYCNCGAKMDGERRWSDGKKSCCIVQK